VRKNFLAIMNLGFPPKADPPQAEVLGTYQAEYISTHYEFTLQTAGQALLLN